jgi:hypothetical protein
MMDLEIFQSNLIHNNKMRTIFKEIRTLFKGRIDEDALKLFALCDRTEININKAENEDIEKLRLFLQRNNLFERFKNRQLQGV